MANSQAMLFLLFALDGVIIGVIFDFFRILRRSFSTGNILTALEDILFWIFVGIILLYSIFVYNNGAIRGYMFLGVFCGATIYMITLSKIFIKINVYILNFIKKILIRIIKIFSVPIKIISSIFINIVVKPTKILLIKLQHILGEYVEKLLILFKNNKKAKK